MKDSRQWTFGVIMKCHNAMIHTWQWTPSMNIGPSPGTRIDSKPTQGTMMKVHLLLRS